MGPIHSNPRHALSWLRAGLAAAVLANVACTGCPEPAPNNPDRPFVAELVDGIHTDPTSALPELIRHQRSGALDEGESFYLEGELAWTRGHPGRAAKLWKNALAASPETYRSHPVVRARLLETLGALECQARIDAAGALALVPGEDVDAALEARLKRAVDLPVCPEKEALEAARAARTSPAPRAGKR